MAEDPEVTIRSCGNCTACCFTHAVDEIKKYEFTECPSCDKNVSCKIYKDRPRACGNYYCAWAVNDVGNDDERPNKVGVVCNTLFSSFTANDPPGILMMEVWPGAINDAPAQALIARILASGTTIRTGSIHAHPRYQYHVLRSTMQDFGQMVEEKHYAVVWHED
jgi:hypothetical protein